MKSYGNPYLLKSQCIRTLQTVNTLKTKISTISDKLIVCFMLKLFKCTHRFAVVVVSGKKVARSHKT